MDFDPKGNRNQQNRGKSGYERIGWDEALDLVAAKLKGVKEAHGSDALGFFTSAKVTNEENYALQKLARVAIGTNNVDHCARL